MDYFYLTALPPTQPPPSPGKYSAGGSYLILDKFQYGWSLSFCLLLVREKPPRCPIQAYHVVFKLLSRAILPRFFLFTDSILIGGLR